MNELEKLNTICFWLIKQCLDANAEEFKTTQTNVNFKGKKVGSWEIIVRKIKEESK